MSKGSQIALVAESGFAVLAFDLDGGRVSKRVIADCALASGSL